VLAEAPPSKPLPKVSKSAFLRRRGSTLLSTLPCQSRISRRNGLRIHPRPAQIRLQQAIRIRHVHNRRLPTRTRIQLRNRIPDRRDCLAYRCISSGHSFRPCRNWHRIKSALAAEVCFLFFSQRLFSPHFRRYSATTCPRQFSFSFSFKAVWAYPFSDMPKLLS
jgi:hypothetical protein